MTKKQQEFINAYLRCNNATEAAILAGFSRKTAKQAGWRALRNAQVKAAIDKVRSSPKSLDALDLDPIIANLYRQAQKEGMVGIAAMKEIFRLKNMYPDMLRGLIEKSSPEVAEKILALIKKEVNE